MPHSMLELEDFELTISQQGSKGMGGLSSGRFGGRCTHRHILFKRLMIFFHFPPSLVNRSKLSLRQVDTAADQIQRALAIIFISKDWSSNN